MDNSEVQLVGGPCGQHGPYTFYKAFKYMKNGVKRVMTLSEFFFVKLWIDSDLLCIGELQLLWIDKNSDQVLSSLRLYFLPENTPEGRTDHGEDEVLAISEKVVLRVEDLITWITVDAEWTWGRLGKCDSDMTQYVIVKKEETETLPESPCCSRTLDCAVESENDNNMSDNKISSKNPSVVVLSYPRYCRYRAMMKRLEGVENDFLKYKIVTALGGFTVTSRNTRILFCRDTFEYPDLEGHELLCNHLAPKLKGRPRGRRKKRSLSPESESNESEESAVVASTSKHKITTEGGRNGLRCDATTSPRRSTRSAECSDSKVFLKELYGFMKENRTPISRVPQLGYKELDLYAFYAKVQKIGGYDHVMTNRLWKSIFDDLTGNHNSTSAATVIRRHYERFLLPYERHMKGEEHKPLPISERRRLKSKASSASDYEKSDSSSCSGTATPVPSCSGTSTPVPSCSGSAPQTPTTPTENKEFNIQLKTSSLRSVRVKPERLKVSTPEKAVSSEEQLSVVSVPSTSFALEKTSEPSTSAVAPVVQKMALEKSLSPVEGKENNSVVDAEEPAKTNNNSMDVIPMSVDSTPEVTDLGDTYQNLTNVLIQEVKKQKLDILKEGGLEVTPITSYQNSRPSVIQQTAPVDTIVVTPDTYYMPPPPPKRPPSNSGTNPSQVTLSPTQMLPRNLRKSAKPSKSYVYANGESPPKVLQSRSIYSYSEKTVYGNPKECFSPNVPPARFVPVNIPPPRPLGGDLLDLSVGSPQKPVVEIMRVPAITTASQLMMKPEIKRASLPMIEGTRIGSNLEITLIGPVNSKTQNVPGQYRHSSASAKTVKKLSHKRTLKDNYATSKFPKTEENGRRPSLPKNNLDISIPTPKPLESKPYTETVPPMFANYLPAQPGKNLQPYLPLLNPLYCSALQNMYSTGGMGPTPPVFPTPEQLQIYQEFIARRFPFPFPDGGSSVATDSHFKK